MKSLIIDTNLLVLLVVGLTRPSLIERHKRTKQFAETDFALLVRLISNSSRIVVTPHTLAETSNLAGNIEGDARREVLSTLARIVQVAEEVWKPAREITSSKPFLSLGLADAAMTEIDDRNSILLTADLDLYLAQLEAGREALNFNHLRDL